MKRSEQVGELVAALAKAQAEFTPALKDSKNPFYNSKYADLAAVIGAVRPALNKHGVILTQDISADLERQVAIVRTSLYHGEQFFEIEIEAPAKGQSKKDEQSGLAGTKFDVQTIGAGTLYLRRYSVAAICGLAAEDEEEDDGNSLNNNNKPIAKNVLCPNCGKDTIIKGREEYGGGWLCYKAKGGCGAKFAVEPATIDQNSSAEPDLPSEVQTAPQTASQRRVGPTKRIPPTPPENVPGLLCTVKRLKESPKKGTVNANISVVFDEVLNGSNQGVAWVCTYATCWHASLFEAIRQSVGKECKFFIKERDAKLNDSDEWPTHFVDIEDVAFITDPATGEFQEYVEGKPVIQAQQ